MRRYRVITVVLLATLLALAVVPPAPARARAQVKEAGFKVIDMAVPFVAKAQGFFERNGLDWEYVEIDSGKLGVAALLSGNAQFTDFGLDDVAGLQKEGKDPILVYSMVNALTMDLVVRNDVLERLKIGPTSPLADKLKALKGLTFGITRPGAVTQLFPVYLLRKAEVLDVPVVMPKRPNLALALIVGGSGGLALGGAVVAARLRRRRPVRNERELVDALSAWAERWMAPATSAAGPG